MSNDNYVENNKKKYTEHDFGNTLVKLLKDNGLSQVWLSNKTGIHESTISRMVSLGDRMTGEVRNRIVLIIKALQDEGVLFNLNKANDLLDKAGLEPLSNAVPEEAAIIQLFGEQSEEHSTVREEPSVSYEVKQEPPAESKPTEEPSSGLFSIQQLRTRLKVRHVWAVIGVFVLVAMAATATRLVPSIMSWWEYRHIEGVQLSSLPPDGQVIYTTSFDVDAGNEWSNTQMTESVTGERFLGEFGVDDEVNLNLRNLGEHRSVVVAFDLYIIRSWYGNYEEEYIFEGRTYRVGPDIWGMKADDQLLMKTTFSNNMGQNGIVYPQAFPDNYGRASYSPGHNARDINSLGYTYIGSPMDTTYEIILKFEHDNPELNLTFFSNTVELREMSQGFESFNTIQNESWGIDNLQIILIEDK